MITITFDGNRISYYFDQKEINKESMNAILLEAKFQKYQLFPKENEDTIIKEAWIHTLKEISNFKARNSLMKTGIMMFEVDFTVPAPKNIGLSAEETTILFKNLTKSNLLLYIITAFIAIEQFPILAQLKIGNLAQVNTAPSAAR